MPPTLRPRPLKKAVPPFKPHVAKNPPSKSWFDLPAEMRQKVIDRMDPKTRCRFAQCSKLCEEEAKKSMHYLHGIEVVNESRHFAALQLRLFHCPERAGMDYWFEFIDTRCNQTIVMYRSSTTDEKKQRDIKWIKIESGQPREVRLRYFKEYADQYKHCIRRIAFNHKKSPNIDFDAKHLTKLENISGYNDAIKIGYFTVKQILNANFVDLEGTNLTFEEVIQLNGSECYIVSDEFNDEAISKYLKMRKNGEVHKNMRKLTIHFGTRQRRNFGEIKNGLSVFNYEEFDGGCEFRFNVKYHLQNGFYAEVIYNNCWLDIEVKPDCRC